MHCHRENSCGSAKDGLGKEKGSRLSHLDNKTRTFTEEHRDELAWWGGGANGTGRHVMGCVPVRPRSFLLPPAAFLSHLPCKSLPWNHHPNGSQCSHLFPGAISGSLGQPWAMPVPQNGRTILLKGILKSNPGLT